MATMRLSSVFIVAVLLAAFIGLNSTGHVTITLGVARLILPTQLEVLLAFFLGVIAMTPFVLANKASTKLITEDKKETKLLNSQREKELEAEVAQLKSEMAKKKNS
jgi:hypothetical protein